MRHWLGPSVVVALPLLLTRLAGAQTWPNEPAGFTVISDHAFTTVLGDGFNVDTGASLYSDASAPLSPPSVLRFSYPVGFPGGVGPGTVSYEGLNLKDIYVGFWWKPSNPWQGHVSNINKLLFITGSAGGNLVPVMCGGGAAGPFHLCMAPEWTDSWTWLSRNVTDPEITLGVWHRIEILAYRSTTATSADGIVRWWMDGTLIGNHTDVNFDGYIFGHNWYLVALNPTWGGVGDTKTEQDYFSFDHIRISAPGPGGGGDLTPPSVAITTPTGSSTYSTTTTPLALGGTSSDNVGVTAVTWANSRGGVGTASGTTTWSVATIGLQPGPNVLTVTARDAAANAAAATLTVTYTPTIAQCRFHWTQPAVPAGNLAAFNVYVGTVSGGPYTKVATVPAVSPSGGQSYGPTADYCGSLGDGTKYAVIKAQNLRGGESAASPEMSFVLQH